MVYLQLRRDNSSLLKQLQQNKIIYTYKRFFNNNCMMYYLLFNLIHRRLIINILSLKLFLTTDKLGRNWFQVKTVFPEKPVISMKKQLFL